MHFCRTAGSIRAAKIRSRGASILWVPSIFKRKAFHHQGHKGTVFSIWYLAVSSQSVHLPKNTLLLQEEPNTNHHTIILPVRLPSPARGACRRLPVACGIPLKRRDRN